MIITRSELFTAYNLARAAARRAGNNPRELERINRALGILQSKAYYQGERMEYAPTHYTCACKDWQYHRAARRQYTGPCKHMWAETLTDRALLARAGRNVTGWIVRAEIPAERQSAQ